jgi:hypothetical protein
MVLTGIDFFAPLGEERDYDPQHKLHFFAINLIIRWRESE